MLTFPTLITGTITGLRISAVDGTAFLDNCAALIPYADGNRRIEIYNASGRILQGYLKAQGAGETTGSDLVDGWTNYVTTPYETFTPGTGPLITQAINAAGAIGIAYKTITIANMLLKNTNAVTVASGTAPYISIARNPGGSNKIQFDTNAISYRTAASGEYTYNNALIFAPGAVDFALTAYSLKQVLTPSTDGVTIVSTKGGAIYNFTSKDASFTYNDASYRYAIYDTLKVVM
jgi:hypothetical protein